MFCSRNTSHTGNTLNRLIFNVFPGSNPLLFQGHADRRKPPTAVLVHRLQDLTAVDLKQHKESKSVTQELLQGADTWHIKLRANFFLTVCTKSTERISTEHVNRCFHDLNVVKILNNEGSLNDTTLFLISSRAETDVFIQFLHGSCHVMVCCCGGEGGMSTRAGLHPDITVKHNQDMFKYRGGCCFHCVSVW